MVTKRINVSTGQQSTVASNTRLTGGITSFVESAPLMTDYAKSSINNALMAVVSLPYFDINDNLWKRCSLTGYMVEGFGWSIQNNYEDLLPVTDGQTTLNRVLQGAGAISKQLGLDNTELGDTLGSFTGKTFISLQQTISIWTGMQKPNFSVQLLFFDAKGEPTTNVVSAAYMVERTLYPYIDNIGQSGNYNLTMTAPGRYLPTFRNESGDINKTFSMTAEGTSSLKIGTFANFPDIILTGASFKFSDKMLDNGNPQWLNITFNFMMWRQPTLADLAYRYA